MNDLSGIELWIVATDEAYYPQIEYFTSEQAAREWAIARHANGFPEWEPLMVARVVQLDGERLDKVFEDLNPIGWWE